MDTQLSTFYLAAHPLYRLMVQFRANGSHPAHGADVLRATSRGIRCQYIVLVHAG